MDAHSLISEMSYGPEDSRYCSPPYPQQLDFGPDYDFDAEPTLPPWLCSHSGSTDPTEENGIIDALKGPNDKNVQVGGPWATSHQSRTVVRAHYNITAKPPVSHRDLVPIAPKVSTSRCTKRPYSTHKITAHYYSFALNSQDGEAPLVSKRQRRGPYSKKTCLRCQNHGIKCSGTFPCSNCAKHWRSMEQRANGVVRWTECFDSDIKELNFMRTQAEFLRRINDIAPDRDTTAVHLHCSQDSEQPPECLLKVTQAAHYLWSTVLSASVDAGMAALLGSQDSDVRRTCIQTLNVETSQQDLSPCIPNSWVAPSCSCQVSGAWVLAVIHIHPEFVTRHSGISDTELLETKAWVTAQLFTITTRLITRAKREVSLFSERLFLYECLATLGTLSRSKASWFAYLEGIQRAITGLLAKQGADIVGLEGVLSDTAQHLEKSNNQQGYLAKFCEHWTKKLFDDTVAGLYKMPFFGLGLLCRLDLSRDFGVSQDPVKQALRFLSHFPETADARGLTRKLQNMNRKGEQKAEDGNVNWTSLIDMALGNDVVRNGSRCTCKRGRARGC